MVLFSYTFTYSWDNYEVSRVVGPTFAIELDDSPLTSKVLPINPKLTVQVAD